MDYQEILRSIYLELTDPIWRYVKVEKNPSTGLPKSIILGYRKLHIKRTIAVLPGYRASEKCYMVETYGGETFTLIKRVEEGLDVWILHLRVQRDEELMRFFWEERKMIVDMEMKRIADFHGHICPELTIGYKACQLASKLLGKERFFRDHLVIVSYNITSSLDAIQMITGCTLGNGRLHIEDWGKHRYIFVTRKTREALRLELSPGSPLEENDPIMEKLEIKLTSGKANLDEIALYQVKVDNITRKLINTPPESLFTWNFFKLKGDIDYPVPTRVKRCGICGEPTIKYALLKAGEKYICRRCAIEKNVNSKN